VSRRLPGWGSVRVRTTLAATAVVTLALVVGTWVLLLTLEGELTRSQDDSARTRARDVASLVSAGNLPSVLAPTNDDSFIQVVDGAGQVVAATSNVRGRTARFTFRPAGVEPVVRTVTGVRDDQDLEDYRVWALRASPGDGEATAYVATSLESVSDAVATLRGLLIVGVPLMTVLLAVVTWTVVGRALRPVESIRAEVADISDSALSRRVPEPPGGDEIAQLARTMNAMLDRLEAASRRQRAFASDASHELQSPLTRLRTHLEVAVAHPESTDWDALAHDLLADSAEMERLVRNLLFLARADERPLQPAADELVDLDDVVLEEVSRLRVGSRVPIGTGSVSAAPVRGSREQLVRLVRNLLENAERHARTQVEVSVRTGHEAVELVVSDDGPGVPPGERDRIFDRFVRLDDDRSRDDGAGSGLGLSIVATIARRHGGSCRVGDSAAGATFVLRLPPLADRV
jgi:signal transduction histidine kinase